MEVLVHTHDGCLRITSSAKGDVVPLGIAVTKAKVIPGQYLIAVGVPGEVVSVPSWYNHGKDDPHDSVWVLWKGDRNPYRYTLSQYSKYFARL